MKADRPTHIAPPQASWIYRSIYFTGEVLLMKVFNLFLKNPPLVEKDEYFKKHGVLDANWRKIREEALSVFTARRGDIPSFGEIEPESNYLTVNDGIEWQAYVLKVYGKEIPSHMDQCPVLASLLRQCPEVTSALFSIIGPGKHIPPHSGPYRGIMRYFLPLLVPGEDCQLRVDKTWIQLVEGRSFMFDDTYDHEVINRCNGYRIALLLDTFRTDMPAPIRILNRWCFNLVGNSKELQAAMRRAELQQDLRQ